MESNIPQEIPIKENPFTRVTPVSKYLVLTLFVLLPFIGGWIGYTYAPEKIVEVEKIVTVVKEIEPVREIVNEQKFDIALTRYEDKELGIAFSYPQEWGEVIVKDESGECPKEYIDDACNQRRLIFAGLLADGGVILASETSGHDKFPIGRGGFWGDYAGHIPKNYLEKCTTVQNCEVLTNQSDVTFAKYYRAIPEMGSDDNPPPSYEYHLFRSDSEYYGTILSSTRIKSVHPEIEKLFEETVVQTFELLP